MTRKAQKFPSNKTLKIAIIESNQTSRRVSIRAHVPEVKLSQIIHGERLASDEEKRALSRVLRRPIQDLFPEAVA